jgi:hypothetical protein
MYFMKAGMATAARMPMMATTIMSSMSVNPLVRPLPRRVVPPGQRFT